MMTVPFCLSDALHRVNPNVTSLLVLTLNPSVETTSLTTPVRVRVLAKIQTTRKSRNRSSGASTAWSNTRSSTTWVNCDRKWKTPI